MFESFQGHSFVTLSVWKEFEEFQVLIAREGDTDLVVLSEGLYRQSERLVTGVHNLDGRCPTGEIIGTRAALCSGPTDQSVEVVHQGPKLVLQQDAIDGHGRLRGGRGIGRNTM